MGKIKKLFEEMENGSEYGIADEGSFEDQAGAEETEEKGPTEYIKMAKEKLNDCISGIEDEELLTNLQEVIEYLDLASPDEEVVPEEGIEGEFPEEGAGEEEYPVE